MGTRNGRNTIDAGEGRPAQPRDIAHQWRPEIAEGCAGGPIIGTEEFGFGASALATLDEIIGRSDLLRAKHVTGWAYLVDVGDLLAEPADASLRKQSVAVQRDDVSLSDRLWAEIEPHVQAGRDVSEQAGISTSDRTVGARIAGNLTALRNAGPMPVSTISLAFRGTAGQSFGAYGVDGLHLSLRASPTMTPARG